MTPRGLIAFPITPADADGRVDEREFRGLLRRLVVAEVDAVCVLGSTGTYAYLAREERLRALQIAASVLGDGVPLMAGIGALRTDLAVQHARDARDAGAILGLLAPMSYTPLSEREVLAHFETVAAEGVLPLCIYDNPAATHFAVSDAMVARLSAILGVVALKAPAPPADAMALRLADLRAATPEGFSVGFSVDWHAAEALIAGGDAWYSVLAGLFPAVSAAMHRAAARGDAEEVRRLDRELAPVWSLFRAHGGLRVIYAAAHAAGLTTRQPPRPILPLAPPDHAQVEAVVRRLRPMLEGERTR